jgi:phosphate transport system substrate-binding protein
LNITNLQQRKYPLWGDQSFWVSIKPGTRIDPKAAEFIRFVLSREGQQLVMEDGKYLPLPADAVAAELAKLARFE